MFKSILSLILISSISVPHTTRASVIVKKAYGHMEPFPEEQIKHPVSLNGYCSNVVITEWTGPAIYAGGVIANLENLCNQALIKFPIDFNKKKKFKWNISILPQGSCYRCLNDTDYRFVGRQNQNYVDSYTSKTFEYTFIPNNVNDKSFDKYFVHELYHAMSMFYGVYGKDNEAKARAFTKKLGLGE